MKFFFFVLFFISTCTVYSQTNRFQEIVENSNGIVQEETLFFEVEGYTISCEKRAIDYSEKGFKKIRFLYSIDKSVELVDAMEFPFAKTVVEEKNDKKSIQKSYTFSELMTITFRLFL